MSSFSFSVPGDPVGKERPRVVRSRGGVRTFTPPKTAGYEALAGLCARAAVSRDWPLDREYVLAIGVYFRTRVHPDLDNVIKSISDALNGIAYADDKRIARIEAERYYDRENPRVEVVITHRQPCLSRQSGHMSVRSRFAGSR